MQQAPPSYMVTEGLVGEQAIWRVVRQETDARGMRSLIFVCGCPTRRAALSLARALGSYRAGTAPDVVLRENGASGHVPLNGAATAFRPKVFPSC